jgi:glycerol uptake facilitator-like aquaporin
MWIVAYKVSGAHFNPATSLAVLIAERKTANLLGFLLTFLVQVAGAFLGVLISFLFIKDYFNFNYRLLPYFGPDVPLYYDPLAVDSTYYGRIIF